MRILKDQVYLIISIDIKTYTTEWKRDNEDFLHITVTQILLHSIPRDGANKGNCYS